MKELYIAVWKPLFAATRDLSLEDKKHLIYSKMIRAKEHLRGVSLRMKANAPLYLFTAPEYYWVKDRDYHLYDEDEKNEIYSYLALASGQLNGLLMAGSFPI